jgi:N,N'-diacetyllegionaminate synthase
MVEIIAEIGWNFMGDMDLAKSMIVAAQSSGATSVKFQYWKTSKLAPGPWDTDGRIEIYNQAQLSLSKIIELRDFCSGRIPFLISAFDIDDAKELNLHGLSEIKIPSHEVYNTELHEYCANNFDKCYVSLGAGTEDETLRASSAYNSGSCEWVAMHCISSYPCPVENANLPRLKFLKEIAKDIGLSDHTQSLTVPAFAVSMGATVVEKHFTTDNDLPGRDNKFALNPKSFSAMVEHINHAALAGINHGNSFLENETDTMKNYRGRWSSKN